jgi:LacI family transcriptional regulator
MSVVAFDDLPSAITINPFFSVAAQPAYEMGKIATEMLLSWLADECPEHCQEIVLPIEVIIRKSSAKPPRQLGIVLEASGLLSEWLRWPAKPS